MSAPGSALRWVAGIAFAIGLALAVPAVASADPGDVGFQGPAGSGGAPSGSKPESKLWFNDGSWWGSLWDTATSDFYIWKLNQATETWTRTNTRLDDRSSTRADVLWDGSKLYVASHNFSENDGPGSARLYRLSYDTGTDTYSIDSGFPTSINSVKTETLVIAKDSTGLLWATWEAGGHIWLNHTVGGDTDWLPTPIQLPGAAAVNTDDISSIIAFDGKVGIFWTNQNASPDADYFAIHQDGAADTAWTIETAYTGTNLADDHVNLKTDSGKVYAVVKTSLDNAGSSPLIVLLDRQVDGTWSSHTVSVSSQNQTRPILEIDETNQLLRVFLTSSGSGGTINQHTSPIGSISFPGGAGTVVMKDASAMKINNPSSTKQNVTSATGLIVLGFNDTTKRYWHADILGGGPPPNTPPTANPTSASTPADQPVSVGLSGSDPETCDLDFSIVTAPAHGTLGSIGTATCTSGSPNTDTASVTYTPSGGYSGPDSFTYRVNDGAADSTPATASLTVTGTDTTPPSRTTTTVNGASLVITYDEPLDTASTPAASAYVPLVNGAPRGVSNVAVAGQAVNLTLASPVVSTDSVTLSYTAPGTNPVQDVAGNDAASFAGAAVTNNTPPSGGGTFTFTPTDDAQVKSTSPTANYGSLATMQLREEAAPSVTYHDYLKFNVTGLSGTVSTVKLRLFITDVSPDSGTVYPVTDPPPPDGPWTESAITWNTAPAIGTGSVGSAGATTVANSWVEITLDPSAVSGNGVVSFALKTTSTNSSIFSSSEGTNPPQLVVTTGGAPPPNTAPTANATSASTTVDQPVSVALSGSDAETCQLTFSIVTPPSHGTLGSIANAGCTAGTPNTDSASVTYTPASGYDGPDSFTYKVIDGTVDSSSATASLTVNASPPPNTAPTANATSAATPAGQAVNVGLSGSDAETCQLTFSIVTPPSHGSLGSIGNAACTAGSPNTDSASVTYTPASGYDGPDSFTYKVNDGTADSTAATATLTVTPVGGGTFTFVATEDAQVRSTSPTTNYGTLATMQLREEPPGGTLPTYRDYLKFHISGVSGTVTSVKLRLYITDVSSDSGTVYGMDTGWTESTIVWNDNPSHPLGAAFGSAGATTVANSWVEITLVGSPVTGNVGDVAFLIKTTSTNSSIFSSSEGTKPPELLVTAS